MKKPISSVYCIYRITCFHTGQVYVGQTIALHNRQNQHWWKLKRGIHHNRRLQSAYEQYGRDAFYFEVLEKDIPATKINEREKIWIKKFDSFKHGYNMTEGGRDLSASHRKICIWNGIEYLSIAAAARANGITPSTMLERLQKGYACDSDILGKGSIQARAKIVIWNGIKYSSLSEAARICGINLSSMAERVSKGYTCDADVRPFVKPHSITWLGVEYPNMVIAAKAHGLTTTGLRNRIAKGFTENDIRRLK